MCIPDGWEIREFQDLWIDFTNEGSTDGIALNSNKIIKIAFDFALTSQFSSGSYSRASFNVPLDGEQGGSVFDFQRKEDGKAYFGFDKYTTNSAFSADDRAYVTEIKDNEIHNLAMYIDMRDENTGYVYYYLDGERMNSANDPANRTDKQEIAAEDFHLKSLSFHLSDILSYLNNLEVASVDDSFLENRNFTNISVQSAVDKNTARMRFIFKQNVGKATKFGVYFIPLSLFKNGSMDTAVVEKNFEINAGVTFSADLTNIPEAEFTTAIYAMPFSVVNDVYYFGENASDNNSVTSTRCN